MIENDPSARMQVRSRGELQLPGSCYVCGNGTCNEGYLDFGTFVDYHGNFYLCMNCARQAAELTGYLSQDSVEFLNIGAKKATEELAATQEELADARKLIDSLNGVLAGRYVSAIGIPSNPVVPKSTPPSSPFGGSSDGESETPQYVSSERRSKSGGSKPRNVTPASDS